MGARLARIFRNFNLENRALREISKEKPSAAPWHPTEAPPSAVSSEARESVKKKNESLLEHLRSVYVESTDPTAATEVRRFRFLSHSARAQCSVRPGLKSF
ncbi:hypothetical protein ILYODFUR_034487 [Ilyodon furcidens]|uniref:NADH dehydrogenase [ubiquinone] 1 alpha subcomplex assembly factor 4 n=1 Tax=Ilyodon furcidens TaxID=33524 RepID=A0ABV0TGG2_9TELE